MYVRVCHDRTFWHGPNSRFDHIAAEVALTDNAIRLTIMIYPACFCSPLRRRCSKRAVFEDVELAVSPEARCDDTDFVAAAGGVHRDHDPHQIGYIIWHDSQGVYPGQRP